MQDSLPTTVAATVAQWIAGRGQSFDERRQIEADLLAWQLATQIGHAEYAPALVQDFIFGPWVRLIAHVRLCELGAERQQRYEAAVAELLWSVNPELTLHRPAEVLRRVPALLATLREGLALLGDNTHECAQFFDDLMQLHRPLLQRRSSGIARLRWPPY